LFHNSNLSGSCIIHILYTGCAKIKKIPAPKGLIIDQKKSVRKPFGVLSAAVDCRVSVEGFGPLLFKKNIISSVASQLLTPHTAGSVNKLILFV